MTEAEQWRAAFAVVITALFAIGMVSGVVYILVDMFGWSGPAYTLLGLVGIFLATAAVKRWAL